MLMSSGFWSIYGLEDQEITDGIWILGVGRPTDFIEHNPAKVTTGWF